MSSNVIITKKVALTRVDPLLLGHWQVVSAARLFPLERISIGIGTWHNQPAWFVNLIAQMIPRCASWPLDFWFCCRALVP